jgi:hypothetical protein
MFHTRSVREYKNQAPEPWTSCRTGPLTARLLVYRYSHFFQKVDRTPPGFIRAKIKSARGKVCVCKTAHAVISKDILHHARKIRKDTHFKLIPCTREDTPCTCRKSPVAFRKLFKTFRKIIGIRNVVSYGTGCSGGIGSTLHYPYCPDR